jgi:N6-adenosine-specific RNA methylase IME4
MTTPDFSMLPPAFFRLIEVDFPWLHESWTRKGVSRSPQRHYPCMHIRDALDWPVRSLADPGGCILAMWARDDMIDQALELMRAWGFAYKTKLVWRKMTKNGKACIGLGRHFRNGSEDLLIGRWGKRTPFRYGPGTRGLSNLLDAPRREHSRKPDEMRQRLERRYRGPYLSMFTRETIEGWASWGNEATKFDGQRRRAA